MEAQKGTKRRKSHVKKRTEIKAKKGRKGKERKLKEKKRRVKASGMVGKIEERNED
jgi:hypothetical protein